MIATDIILVIGIVIFFLQCIFIATILAKIHGSLQVLNQIVAVAIQRSGLVRTPEEVEADAAEAEAEEAEEVDEDLLAMQSEIEEKDF